MRNPIRYALRFVAIVAVVASFALVSAPPPRSDTPYLSALSALTFGSEVAAASCSHIHCAKGTSCSQPDPHHKTNCQLTSTGCTTVSC